MRSTSQVVLRPPPSSPRWFNGLCTTPVSMLQRPPKLRSQFLTMSYRLIIFRLILVSVLFGCSESTVSKDGSAGTLTFGTQTLGDICVVVHKKDGAAFQQLGFGTTDGSGNFFLLKTVGEEALILEPGDYSFTLEPVGPQIAFPANYLQPEKSPLMTTWTADMTSLDLNAPQELLKNLPK